MSGGPVVDEKGKVIGIHGRGDPANGSKESYGIPIQKFLAYKSDKIISVAKKIEDKISNYINRISWSIIIRRFTLLSTGILGSYLLVLISSKIFYQLRRRRVRKSKKLPPLEINYNYSEINPNYALAYFNRGNARDDLGDKEGAIADYNKAIEINPNNANAYYNRGNARSDLGDKQSAIADYNKAIEINPNYASAYNNRGNARDDLGDKEGAIADYNKAIKINPNYALAYFNRGNARYDLGDKESAIADLDKAAELFKKDGNEGNYRLTLKLLKELLKELRGE